MIYAISEGSRWFKHQQNCHPFNLRQQNISGNNTNEESDAFSSPLSRLFMMVPLSSSNICRKTWKAEPQWNLPSHGRSCLLKISLFWANESKWDNMDHGQCFICMLYIYIDISICMFPTFFLYFHMHGQCSIWNMLKNIYIYVHVPLGGILKAKNSPDRHPRLDSWTCGPGGDFRWQNHWKTRNIPWGLWEDYWIVGRTIYPPTPAICRGSAPEKKWLCGVMKGQA